MNMTLKTHWGGGLTVKWNEYGENAMPGCKERQEKEPGQEGGWEGQPQFRSIKG